MDVDTAHHWSVRCTSSDSLSKNTVEESGEKRKFALEKLTDTIPLAGGQAVTVNTISDKPCGKHVPSLDDNTLHLHGRPPKTTTAVKPR